jgi:hypothetical protein
VQMTHTCSAAVHAHRSVAADGVRVDGDRPTCRRHAGIIPSATVVSAGPQAHQSFRQRQCSAQEGNRTVAAHVTARELTRATTATSRTSARHNGATHRNDAVDHHRRRRGRVCDDRDSAATTATGARRRRTAATLFT